MNTYTFGDPGKLIVFVLTVAFLSTAATTSKAQKTRPPTTRILFVLDGSQSMLGRWNEGQKIKVATELLKKMVDSLKTVDNVQVALRIYGHQSSMASGGRNCKDTKLEVPFGKNNHEAIKNKLGNIYPKGTTPIAYSLEQAANDFQECNNCLNTIILITDGIEECDGDPCAVSLALQRKGIVLKPFVIGMGLDLETVDALDCVGNFFNTKDEDAFRSVLNIVISQALNNTTVQVNLLDEYGKPTETNVNMTFYDNFTGNVRYNFVHTMNYHGKPDTLPVDPLGAYDLVVHTLPPVRKDSISFTAGKHNVVAVPAAQGDLLLKIQEPNDYDKLRCIVRQDGEMKTLYVQEFNEKQKYLTGKYDLEVLSLPRIYIDDVVISQSHTTKVEIPPPGLLIFSMPGQGHASLYLEKDNHLEWIYKFNENTKRHNLLLQPGKYRVVYRSSSAHQAVFTREEQFEISSGSSSQVKF